MNVGDIFKNTKGNEFKINKIFYNKTNKTYKCEVEFVENGYKRIVSKTDAEKGLIRDRLQKEICGVACLGYAHKKGNEKIYSRWHSMIKRCYEITNKGYISYGAKGVFVCDRWLRFDYFLEDLSKIDGYNKELFNSGMIHLDKDIKLKGNKIYSLETCCFVDKKTNDEHRNLNHGKGKKKVKVSFSDGSCSVFDSLTSFSKMFLMTKSKASYIVNRKDGKYNDMTVSYIGGN